MISYILDFIIGYKIKTMASKIVSEELKYYKQGKYDTSYICTYILHVVLQRSLRLRDKLEKRAVVCYTYTGLHCMFY